MKKILLIHLTILSFFLTAKAQVTVDTIIVNGPVHYGIEKLIVEKTPVSAAAIAKDVNLTSNHITYRIFVDLAAGFKFIVCGGVDSEPPTYMLLETSTTFYNETVFGTASSKGANPVLFPIYPQLEYDTYAADGRVGNTHVGVLKSVNPTGYIPITPETTPIGGDLLLFSVANFLDLLTDNETSRVYDFNSGWSVSGGIAGPDTVSNIVFIGQFTTDGELLFNVMIWSQDPNINLRSVKNITYGFFPEPRVKITSPENNAFVILDTPFDIEASVKDIDGTIDSVEFMVDNVKIQTFIMEPNTTADTLTHNFTFSTLGTHIVKVIATDNEGNVSKDSITVIASEIKPPVVSITQPVNNSETTIDSTLIIIAEATDDGTIDSVEFFVGNTKIGIDVTAPYQINWNPDETGTYTIRARATDNDTLSSFSETISVVVKPVSVIKVTQSKPELSVYPNPAKNSISLEYNSLKSGSIYTIHIYDITGNVLESKSFKSISGNQVETIDISALKKGIYILKLTGSDISNKYTRFIKNIE